MRCAASTASAARPFDKWKARYGGMEVSDARRLKALEDENAKLKKLLAEAMLDNAMLRDGPLRAIGGYAPRPVAAPSRTGSNDQPTLLIAG